MMRAGGLQKQPVAEWRIFVEEPEILMEEALTIPNQGFDTKKILSDAKSIDFEAKKIVFDKKKIQAAVGTVFPIPTPHAKAPFGRVPNRQFPLLSQY
jgi:hypothetical protein